MRINSPFALACAVGTWLGGCTLVGFDPVALRDDGDALQGGNGGTTAGDLGVGGRLGSGGTDATGGGSTGGGSSTTGGLATGGNTSGTTSSGGSTMTGGDMGSGGTASGGTTTTTGGAASGGVVTSGGAASGGAVTGGIGSTGGTATGGTASGGTAVTGGTATGGTASGGTVATGGTATGGTASGGTPTDAGMVDPFLGITLLHRYDFSGTGTVAPDLVGNADAQLRSGAQLSGNGDVSLDGIDEHIELPPGTISTSGSRSFVFWVDVGQAQCDAHLFDFGNSSAGRGLSGTATSSLFVETENCYTGVSVIFQTPRMGYVTPTDAWRGAGWLSLNSGRRMIVVTFNAADGRTRYYADLTNLNSRAFPVDLLQTLDDQNNWIGRSQDSNDPYFRGTIDEFRIYDGVLDLDTTSIDELFNAGPDVVLP